VDDFRPFPRQHALGRDKPAFIEYNFPKQLKSGAAIAELAGNLFESLRMIETE
jgi:hypothetical protein